MIEKFTVNGITSTLEGLCEYFCADYDDVVEKLDKGWPLPQALGLEEHPDRRRKPKKEPKVITVKNLMVTEPVKPATNVIKIRKGVKFKRVGASAGFYTWEVEKR